MNLKGLWQLSFVETKLLLREPEAVFFTFLFLPLMLFIFGGIYGNEPVPIFYDFGSVDYFVPGYMVIGLASGALWGIGATLAGYRERRILYRLRATPLRPGTIIASQVLVTYVVQLLSALILALLAWLIFRLRVGGNFLAVLAAFTMSALSLFSAGFIVASLCRTARIANAVSMSIFFPMMFLSGAAIPLEVMPESFKTISKFIPLTYSVNLMRDIWFGRSFGQSWENLVVLMGILVLGSLISAKTFRWE